MCKRAFGLDVGKDIDFLTETIYKSIVMLNAIKKTNPKHKLGYINSPGGILNAYREGDLTFDDAKLAIVNLPNKKETI